jgi:hypothetical protein
MTGRAAIGFGAGGTNTAGVSRAPPNVDAILEVDFETGVHSVRRSFESGIHSVRRSLRACELDFESGLHCGEARELLDCGSSVRRPLAIFAARYGLLSKSRLRE